MENIICYLIAIKRWAKEIHYRSKGDGFWGNHLLSDRVVDGLDDFVDEIQENYYLGHGEEVPLQKNILLGAANLIEQATTEKDMFIKLDMLIIGCLTELQMIDENNHELSLGDKDLMGRISSDLQKKHGFIWRRIKE